MINGKKVIALSGVESTGKTTTATMLCGRLRTRGVLAELVYEPGASAPFDPSFLDKGIDGWVYQVTNRISLEVAKATRANVEYLILDRTPLDFIAYYLTRFPSSPMSNALHLIAAEWTRQYDQVYYLSPENTVYRDDGYRADHSINTWREPAAERMELLVRHSQVPVQVVSGSYRERSEFIYHHVLFSQFGETRPLRAYQQVRQWMEERKWRVLEVRPQGSNSLTRFHPPSDNDDIDMMVVVDGDADYAIACRADFMAHKDHLENIVQADLDVLITPKGMQAHEV